MTASSLCSKLLRVVFLLSAAFAIISCSSKAKPQATDLSGKWHLEMSEWARVGCTMTISITDENGTLHGTWRTKAGYAGREEHSGRYVYEDGTFGGMVVNNEVDLHWSQPLVVDGKDTGSRREWSLTGRVEGNKMRGKSHSKTVWDVGTLATAAKVGITMDPAEQDGQWMATKE